MRRLCLVPYYLALLTPVGVDARPGGDAGALEVVTKMAEAHGGLSAWASAPTVTFTETWSPEEENPVSSTMTVEQGARRSYMDNTEGASIVWDGERCWSVNWESSTPPRFLAQLTFYFVNLPWLALDPGVVLHEPGTARLWDDPTEYITIKMTYEAGTGDTPDDYYVLFIDPETHLLKGCEYIVTYADILPEGVAHSPPKVLVFEGYESVGGLVVPAGFIIYKTDQSEYARCTVTDWSFEQPFDESRMEMPETAVIDTSSPDQG